MITFPWEACGGLSPIATGAPGNFRQSWQPEFSVDSFCVWKDWLRWESAFLGLREKGEWYFRESCGKFILLLIFIMIVAAVYAPIYYDACEIKQTAQLYNY